MGHFTTFLVFAGLCQVILGASVEDKYEPMVAFICERPAMHRTVNGWVEDKSTDCLTNVEEILTYCKSMYPDHDITNVVEASYLVTIPDWPMNAADRRHPHRVRPFRCLVGGFQSDALLVPQHCVFDHRHDQRVCEGFAHWNVVADESCKNKDMHLESFGMLLNCKLGMFSGVEYVCCPNGKLIDDKVNYHKPQKDDKPDSWEDDSSEEDFDDDDDSSETATSQSSSDEDLNEDVIDLYEVYLRGQVFPRRYTNEHKKFLAAKERMKKNQQVKTTKLLQQWQEARDHVDEVRKVDSKKADSLSDDIASRFQKLYASYEQEDAAEKQQLMALHQQHVQAALNERKRDAMDKYMKALEKGEVERIIHTLRNYIKAEEKDRMHTVNHFEHVKYSNAREALRIHPFIVNHLKLSEQRIDQSLEMLHRYPEVEIKVKKEIDEFMTRFDAIANSIKNVVLPMPKVEDEPETKTLPQSVHQQDEKNNAHSDDDIRIDDNFGFDQAIQVDEEGDDTREDEHDYEKINPEFVAHAQNNKMHVQHGFAESAASHSQVGSTIGIALGGVSVFVIVVVAIIMMKRRNRSQYPSPGYVEVDPSASPEERHVANMQMNGYENPTYKYFEVQNPKA